MSDALDLLAANRSVLARTIAEAQFARNPELERRYGAAGLAHCTADAAYHLQYLEQALRVRNEELFADYARWAKIMLEARHIPVADLAFNLTTVADVVAEAYPALASNVRQFIAAALRALEARAETGSASEPHAELADAYLTAVLAGDRRVAGRLVNDAISRGVSLHDIYLHVFQRTQHEIGRLWQTNEIGVADEHLATAITQMIMSQLYPLLFSGPRREQTFVSACVGGELHEIGARMVADFFEMDGWKTYYLGANTPVSGIVKTICDRKADVAGISVTISFNLAAAKEVIQAIRSEAGCRGTKVIVGGYPFRVAPDLWKTIGADGCAANAADAIALAGRLVGERT
jgi:MerR family transcriptional regulator, light-induced transcriptional regulator